MNKNKNLFAAARTALLIASGAAFADHPSADFGSNTSGPITTIPAATLPKGAIAMGLKIEYVESDRYSDSELERLAGQHIHAHSSDHLFSPSIGFSYGVTDDLTLGLRLPYLRRENIREAHHSHGAGGVAINEVERRGDAKGFGDLSILGKYRFLHGQAWQAALLFGIEAPTGETDKKDREGQRFETEHQPGSGSWDPLLGFAFSKGFGRVVFDLSLLHAFSSEGAQDTELGDRTQYSVAASYRLRSEPHDHGAPHVHGEWDLIFELNGEREGKHRVDGETEEDSGGTIVYLSPGVRFVSPNSWSGALSVGIPVVNNIRRSHPENDYRVIAGLSKAF